MAGSLFNNFIRRRSSSNSGSNRGDTRNDKKLSKEHRNSTCDATHVLGDSMSHISLETKNTGSSADSLLGDIPATSSTAGNDSGNDSRSSFSFNGDRNSSATIASSISVGSSSSSTAVANACFRNSSMFNRSSASFSSSDRGLLVIEELITTEQTYVRELDTFVELYCHRLDPCSSPGSNSSSTSVSPSSLHFPNSSPKRLSTPVSNVSNTRPISASVNPQCTSSFSNQNSYLQQSLSLSINASSHSTILSPAEHAKLFSNVEAILRFHRDFFLPKLSNASGKAELVATTFIEHAPFLMLYTSFINTSVPAIADFESWCARRPALRRFVRATMRDPRHSQLSFASYLILPVQRIPRYRMLLSELLSATSATDRDHERSLLSRALTAIEDIATKLNIRKREQEANDTLVILQRRLRFAPGLPRIDLIAPYRRLLLEGTLCVLRHSPPDDIIASIQEASDACATSSFSRRVSLLSAASSHSMSSALSDDSSSTVEHFNSKNTERTTDYEPIGTLANDEPAHNATIVLLNDMILECDPMEDRSNSSAQRSSAPKSERILVRRIIGLPSPELVGAPLAELLDGGQTLRVSGESCVVYLASVKSDSAKPFNPGDGIYDLTEWEKSINGR